MKIIISESIKNKIKEELAELEHIQWEEWSKDIAKKEDISKERLDRWRKYWIKYKDLDEETKDEDRKWAEKALKIFLKHKDKLL